MTRDKATDVSLTSWLMWLYLAVAVGVFYAIFWRGWSQLTLMGVYFMASLTFMFKKEIDNWWRGIKR